MSIPELTTGTVFAGYQIDGVAGEGGMGVVYRATEIALQRPVALKLIAEDFAGDRKFRERFQRESMLAASIDHPNVIPVYEAGEVDGELYIAMRFVDGTDLLQLVTREGACDPTRAVRIVSQVAAALDAAHRRGLVHRDVKPGNVLLTGEGEEEHVYLTDFGLVKTLEGDPRHHHRRALRRHARLLEPRGDPGPGRRRPLRRLLARLRPLLHAHAHEPVPARLQRRHDVRPRQRAAALAAGGRTRSSRPALGAVVEKGLAKNPDERHQTAGEFARAAQEALAAGGAQEAPPQAGTADSRDRGRPAAPQPRARHQRCPRSSWSS